MFDHKSHPIWWFAAPISAIWAPYNLLCGLRHHLQLATANLNGFVKTIWIQCLHTWHMWIYWLTMIMRVYTCICVSYIHRCFNSGENSCCWAGGYHQKAMMMTVATFQAAKQLSVATVGTSRGDRSRKHLVGTETEPIIIQLTQPLKFSSCAFKNDGCKSVGWSGRITLM